MNGNEFWCTAKGKDNQALEKSWQGICPGCCVYCRKKSCSLRTCELQKKNYLCCWRASPVEWMMGRLSEKAKRETYARRRYEHYLKLGFFPEDGTWEGECLKRFKEKYPDVYEEIYKKICK